ncbi:MAG TPA: DUF4349 domain-containing protein, partial [Terriglobia bacterium]|nr:DUF4349 domain-containing protein [Terriglobia bacterium]
MSHEHPISPEELMAYADSQLSADRTSQIGAHLESCRDCAEAVADAKALSSRLATWQIEDAPEPLTRSVLAALETRPRRNELRSAVRLWTKGRVLAYGFGGAVFVLTAVAGISLVQRYREMREYDTQRSAGLSAPEEIPRTWPFIATPPPPPPPAASPQGTIGRLSTAQQPVLPSSSTSGPLIIRSVQLTLVTKSFETARTRIEAIVQESKGYVDSLSVRSEPKSPKSLSAVLRIPEMTLAASLIELRKLGEPKQESQNSADITGQYVDLVARLSNARNTEQRLLALLRDRTGSLKDVVAAEGEISRVREEI